MEQIRFWESEILNDELIYFNDSGIKSNMDTDNITPLAKEHAEAINLFSFLIFINIGIVPNIVDNPARVVKINGYNIFSPS